MWECRPQGGGDAGHVSEKDPRLSLSARVQRVVHCGRVLQERRRGGPAVLGRDVMSALRQGCSSKTASVLPQCTMCTSMSSGLRSMLKATVKVVASFCVALRLRLFDAAAAAPGLMHQEDAAGRLVDVHDAVCADSVVVHQPAQLDEQPVRVGQLQSRAVELFQALGGLLEAQAHATQELSEPLSPGTDVEPSASSHSCTRP